MGPMAFRKFLTIFFLSYYSSYVLATIVYYDNAASLQTTSQSICCRMSNVASFPAAPRRLDESAADFGNIFAVQGVKSVATTIVDGTLKKPVQWIYENLIEPVGRAINYVALSLMLRIGYRYRYQKCKQWTTMIVEPMCKEWNVRSPLKVKLRSSFMYICMKKMKSRISDAKVNDEETLSQIVEDFGMYLKNSTNSTAFMQYYDRNIISKYMQKF